MTTILLLWLPVTLAAPKIFPLVDPGLFVISGVKTCGGGGGYCLLGLDCTLDEDFLPDNEAGQHCDGLKSAFTPSAHFVCCRATNKTVYKPPIVFPSVATTTNTESMTARTTTLNILENEIDQVLQKVAQSVNAVTHNKLPVTEATLPKSEESDETSELRETEDSDDEGGEDDDDEMVADSPIEELWQEMSADDDDLEDLSAGILAENKEDKESLDITKPVKINIPTMAAPNDQTQNIEEPSIEKDSEENTIIPGDILKSSVTEENVDSDNDDDDDDDDEDNNMSNGNEDKENPLHKNQLQDNPNPISSVNSPPHEDISHKDSESLNPAQETKEIIHTNNSVYKGKIPQLAKDGVTDSSVVEMSNVNDVLDASDKENKEDNLILQATPKPDNIDDAINDSDSTVINDETPTNINEDTNLLPTEISENQENMMTPINNESNLHTSTQDEKNQGVTSTDKKESNTELPGVSNGNDTILQTENTTDMVENQLVTTTPVSPATHMVDVIHPTVMQGQPGSNKPCAKVTGENCTQEVKFTLNNQTLCFGSVYALDWVVTSASCALRVFRAGMLNVIISPITDTSRGHVKTIVVHESYAENSGASGQGMEANNIGLVQLQTPMVQWSPCVPCLPEAGKEFTGVNCSAVTSQPLAPTPPRLCSPSEECKSARSENPVNTCEGQSRLMRDDIGFSYITLNCDTLWEPRFFDPAWRGSGAPLFCEGGVLAGVETGAGVGLMVYTPLTPYLPWLLKNTRPGTPDQTFNVG